MTQTQSPEPLTIWINENDGRVACTRHGGAYLTYGVEASPRKVRHVTPLGTWVKVRAEHVEASLLPDEDGETFPLNCETCKAPPLV